VSRRGAETGLSVRQTAARYAFSSFGLQFWIETGLIMTVSDWIDSINWISFYDCAPFWPIGCMDRIGLLPGHHFMTVTAF
jgi:hypothetical protein